MCRSTRYSEEFLFGKNCGTLKENTLMKNYVCLRIHMQNKSVFVIAAF